MKRIRLIIEIDTEMERGKFNVATLLKATEFKSLGDVVYVATEIVQHNPSHFVTLDTRDFRTTPKE